MLAQGMRVFFALAWLASSVVFFAGTSVAGDPYTLCGTVTAAPQGGTTAAVSGATMSFDGGTTTTDGTGGYCFDAIPGDSGTIYAEKNGYLFDPDGIPVSSVSGNVSGLDFSGLQLPSAEFVGSANTQLNFHPGDDNMTSGPQTVPFGFTGPGWNLHDITWTATSDSGYIFVSPESGTGPGELTIYYNHEGVTSGTHTSQVTLSSPSVSESLVFSIAYDTTPPTSLVPPIGTVDTPKNGQIVSGSVPITGWALDEGGVQGVEISRQEGASNVYVGDAVQVHGARPDVAEEYSNYYSSNKAGWGYMLQTHTLSDGTYTFEAIATDYHGNEGSLGTLTLTIDNSNSVKPFGDIDFPAEGGTISGNELFTGWALTPQPNTIPTDGSTITVYVDGLQEVVSPSYNNYRSDIESLYPRYNNSYGAGISYLFDPTNYANGMHTIQWTVTDDDGNTDGVGSRYFTIYNIGSRRGSRAKTARSAQLTRAGARGTPDEYGMISLDLEELFGTTGGWYSGCLLDDGNHLVLPAGAQVTGDGIFAWDPGPAVQSGRFTFEFERIDLEGNTDSKTAVVVIGLQPNLTPVYQMLLEEPEES